jgi:hypothetical protein
MTREDIIRLAREAGMERVVKEHSDGTRTVELPHPDLLARFAALVAAEKDKEIERLKTLLYDQLGELTRLRAEKQMREHITKLKIEEIADDIRARSET